jgi:hypothetical protein
MEISASTLIGLGSAAGLILSARVVYNTLREANDAKNRPTKIPKNPEDFKTMTFDDINKYMASLRCEPVTVALADISRIWVDPPQPPQRGIIVTHKGEEI